MKYFKNIGTRGIDILETDAPSSGRLAAREELAVLAAAPAPIFDNNINWGWCSGGDRNGELLSMSHHHNGRNGARDTQSSGWSSKYINFSKFLIEGSHQHAVCRNQVGRKLIGVTWGEICGDVRGSELFNVKRSGGMDWDNNIRECHRLSNRERGRRGHDTTRVNRRKGDWITNNVAGGCGVDIDWCWRDAFSLCFTPWMLFEAQLG